MLWTLGPDLDLDRGVLLLLRHRLVRITIRLNILSEDEVLVDIYLLNHIPYPIPKIPADLFPLPLDHSILMAPFQALFRCLVDLSVVVSRAYLFKI